VHWWRNDGADLSTRFILLRHGQIKANRIGRWHGSTDSPLTWRGRRQAKRTGKHLRAHVSLDAVYASPLQRCQHTAKFATRGMGLDIETIDGLQEMGIGEWEDMPFRELVDRHDFINRSTADIHHRAPRGESLHEVSQRVTAAFRHIDEQHADDETVLVVSHGVALAVALATFLHQSPTRWIDYHFNNCSLTEFELSPEPLIHRFNEYAHL
jgi:broad specificity phosphatase PhoE